MIKNIIGLLFKRRYLLLYSPECENAVTMNMLLSYFVENYKLSTGLCCLSLNSPVYLLHICVLWCIMVLKEPHYNPGQVIQGLV